MKLEQALLVDPIERDDNYKRDYIPMPGGWEIQTKGEGSTYRICDRSVERRLPIPDSPYLFETLTKMATDVNAAWAEQVSVLSAEISRLNDELAKSIKAHARQVEDLTKFIEDGNVIMEKQAEAAEETGRTLLRINEDLKPIIKNSKRWLCVLNGSFMSDGRPFIAVHNYKEGVFVNTESLTSTEAEIRVDSFINS